MPSPQPPHDKSPETTKEAVRSFTRRLDRAASDLNPFLMVLAIGLIVLNLTLYIAMAAAGGASAAAMRRPAAAPQAAGDYPGGAVVAR